MTTRQILKAIQYMSLLVQGVLILCALAVLLAGAIDKGYLFAALYVQIAIGAWQYCGSIFSALIGRGKINPKLIHLILSTLYLLLLFNTPPGSSDYLVTLIVPSWTLAIFYFVACIRTLRHTKHSGRGFLPHLSF